MTKTTLLIDIVASATPERFDVLVGGVSYKIHRALLDTDAVQRAAECIRIAKTQGLRARMEPGVPCE